jgi:hypothetical protein
MCPQLRRRDLGTGTGACPYPNEPTSGATVRINGPGVAPVRPRSPANKIPHRQHLRPGHEPDESARLAYIEDPRRRPPDTKTPTFLLCDALRPPGEPGQLSDSL